MSDAPSLTHRSSDPWGVTPLAPRLNAAIRRRFQCRHLRLIRTPNLTKSLRWALPQSPNRACHRGSKPGNRPIGQPRAGLGWPTAIADTADHCRTGLTPWKCPAHPAAGRLGREEGSSRPGGSRHCWSLKHEYQSAWLLAGPVPLLQVPPQSEHRVRIAMAVTHPKWHRRPQHRTRRRQPTEHFAGSATCAESYVRVVPIRSSWIEVCRLSELEGYAPASRAVVVQSSCSHAAVALARSLSARARSSPPRWTSRSPRRIWSSSWASSCRCCWLAVHPGRVRRRPADDPDVGGAVPLVLAATTAR